MLNTEPVAAKLTMFICAVRQTLLSSTPKSHPSTTCSWQSHVPMTEMEMVRFSCFCYKHHYWKSLFSARLGMTGSIEKNGVKDD